MKVEFIYSMSSEMAVVRETLQDSVFIIKNGYQCWLPKGIGFNSQNNDIQKAVSKSFKHKKVGQVQNEIKKSLLKHKNSLDLFLSSLGLQTPAKLVVVLTKFGTGGSYELPNRIIINVQKGYSDPFATFIHELIHLLIEEPVVKANGLNHLQKEGLVDYIILHDPYLQKTVQGYCAQDETILPTSEQVKQWLAFLTNYKIIVD